MRAPHLVVYEADRWMADLLRGTAGTWGWTLREVRQPDACLRGLRNGGPAVMVLELGRDLAADLALLARVARTCPWTAIVAVQNVISPELSGLAWDLGAAWVFAPPHPRDALLPLVLALMETAAPAAPGDEARA